MNFAVVSVNAAGSPPSANVSLFPISQTTTLTWYVLGSAFVRRNRSHLVRTLFGDRVSNEQFRRLSDGRISFDAEPRTYQVSVVVCDIGNRLTFAEGGEPAAFTETTAKFIRETAARLVEQGAYLQAADGEGVVGVFGFPATDPEHAQKAT